MRCLSRKHWIVYVLPTFFFLFGGLLALTGAGWAEWRFLLLVGILMQARALYDMLVYRSKQWVLTDDCLILKTGILPWTKADFHIPHGELYEAYHTTGFLPKILGYATLVVRRTDGTASAFWEAKMTQPTAITGAINAAICANKTKQQPALQQLPSTYSLADELSKLNELLEASVITDSEFREAKLQLLGDRV